MKSKKTHGGNRRKVDFFLFVWRRAFDSRSYAPAVAVVKIQKESMTQEVKYHV